MKIAMMIYILSKVDLLSFFFGVISGLVLIVAHVFLLFFQVAAIEAYSSDEDRNSAKIASKKVRGIRLVFIPILVFALLLPNSQTVAAMYLVPRLAESRLANIPAKLMTVLEQKLDDYLKEFEPKKASDK